MTDSADAKTSRTSLILIMAILGVAALAGMASYFFDDHQSSSIMSEPSGPVTPLVAKVRASRLQMEIENASPDKWWHVEIAVSADGTYRKEYDYVEPREKFSVDLNDFADSSGKRFNPFAYKPQRVTITATIDSHRSTMAYSF